MRIEDDPIYAEMLAHPERILTSGERVTIDISGPNIRGIIEDEGPDKGRLICLTYRQCKGSVRAQEVLC